MEELVKALNRYIARDLVFLVAGGAVVLTLLYVLYPPPRVGSDWPTVVYLLAAGIGYVVAYTFAGHLQRASHRLDGTYSPRVCTPAMDVHTLYA